MKRLIYIVPSACVLAIALCVMATADFPMAGTGQRFKGDGAGSITDPTIPVVTGTGVVLTLTPTLDTTTYASGDVLFSTAELAGAMRATGGRGYLQSIHVLDEDDMGQGFEILFLNASTTIGAVNATCAVTDTNARNIIGRVTVTTSNYLDLGGSRVATLGNLGLMLQSSGTTSLFVAGVSTGTGLYSASGLKLQIGIKQD